MPPMTDWTIDDAIALYGIDRWGRGYFEVGANGAIRLVTPNGPLDLARLTHELRHRGLDTPVLVRLLDVLDARVAHINGCFERAIEAFDYRGEYRGVYPIKVNQQRQVVERLLKAGRPYHLGLEVGSKPELLAAVAMMEDPEALILCNGFKDEKYVETALLCRRLQEDVVITLDRPEELELTLAVAQRLAIEPKLGVRCKLATVGAGRWAESGGDRAKFGLSLTQILEVIRHLESVGMLDCLVLLHFHIGSQISDIATFKLALKEAVRVYVELRKLGAPLHTLDVGGGLGVDYTGFRDNRSDSSLNYDTQEYANDVIYWVRETCDAAGVPHPTLVSESGRSLVAYHSVLVFDVLGTNERTRRSDFSDMPADRPQVVEQLLAIQENLTEESVVEDYHDALHLQREYLNLFRYGVLDVRWRAVAEQLFADICTQILEREQHWSDLPRAEGLRALRVEFADIYYGNFSVFQSLPDVWAIDQLFPLVPLHRLNEPPSRSAIVADLTCDSDGKIDRFVGDATPRRTLRLHALNGEPYLLGAFMVGAYQEILGDMHNLFGDTNAVTVTVGKDGQYEVEHVLEGESIAEALEYVEISATELQRKMRRRIEAAVRQGRLDLKQSRGFLKTYGDALRGSTYLERASTPETER